MIDLLMEPLQYLFVVRGLLGGVLAAVACAVLSAYVVWRGMAFVGDAMAHAILPGIVIAYAAGITLFAGALAAAIVAVFLIGVLSHDGRIKEDTAIGVIFAGLFALGILLLSKVATYRDLSHILFGNVLGIGTADLIRMAIVVVAVLAGIAASYKELLVTSFDPAHAVAIGLSPTAVRYLLLIMLAMTTVVAIQSVGVVLVLALLVTPGAAASLLSRKLGTIMILSVLIALFATIAGFYLSYYFNVASGASIVLVLTAIFMVSYLATIARRS